LLCARDACQTRSSDGHYNTCGGIKQLNHKCA